LSRYNHRAHRETIIAFTRVIDVLPPSLCALYIIILVYTSCYPKTITLQTSETTINLKLRNSRFKIPEFKDYRSIITSFGDHRVFLWALCGFMLFHCFL